MLVREDTRRKCGQTVVVESECERGEEREDDNGMEVSERRETSENGRGKGGKTVDIKRWRKKKGKREWNGKEELRRNEEI